MPFVPRAPHTGLQLMVALSLPTGAETLATSQNGEVGLPGRLKKRKKCTAATQVAMGGQKTAFGKALLKGSGAGKEKIPPPRSF